MHRGAVLTQIFCVVGSGAERLVVDEQGKTWACSAGGRERQYQPNQQVAVEVLRRWRLSRIGEGLLTI